MNIISKQKNKMIKLLAAVLVAVSPFATTLTAQATSANVKGTLVIEPGISTIESTGVVLFDEITLGTNYQYQSIKNMPKITINDASGTGHGYTVNAKTDGFKDTNGTNEISDARLEIVKTIDQNNTNTGEITGSGYSIIEAPVGEVAMGIVNYEFPDDSIRLTFDASKIKKGTYEATIVYTFSVGPGA